VIALPLLWGGDQRMREVGQRGRGDRLQRIAVLALIWRLRRAGRAAIDETTSALTWPSARALQ
jgi:hypothetical protein